MEIDTIRNEVIIVLMKPRKPPLILDSLSAAVRRIVPYHTKEQALQSRLSAVQAGYAGELVLDRVFEHYMFSFPHAIFHDLSLNSSTRFQVDTLFVTSSHAVVLEVKNIAGALTLRNNPPQLIRTLENGQTNSFESPVSQLERKIELLQDWLVCRSIHLPVKGAIVLAHPKHAVSAETAEVPFLYPSGIPSYLRRLASSTSVLLPDQFSLLNDQLLQGHHDFFPQPICESYSLTNQDFRSGVFCETCAAPTMLKSRLNWYCSVCEEKSTKAGDQAIRDWFLLFGGTMSNQQCRDFLHLSNRHMAYRILKKMEFQIVGGSKNRRYFC